MEKKTIIGIISQISLIGAFVIIALGCATTYDGTKTAEQLKYLIGSPVSDAIQQFGPQDNIQDDGQGGKIYTWVYDAGRTHEHSPGSIFGNDKIVSTNDKCRRHVYVNSAGIIYYGRWDGNYCE